jgi:hypothetical protein
MSKSKCKNCRKVDRLERELEETQILLFATVRNSAVLPLGVKLGKTEKEISEKTFETIVEMKKTVDYAKTRKVMELANWRDEDAEEEATEND